MAVSYTANTIEKLENILKTQGYTVAFEKGNFRTAACILNKNKVVVVNKFSGLESRINSMVDLIREMDLDDTLLDDKQRIYYNQLKKSR